MKSTVARKCTNCRGKIGDRWKCQHCDRINPTPEYWIAMVLVSATGLLVVWFVLAMAAG